MRLQTRYAEGDFPLRSRMASVTRSFGPLLRKTEPGDIRCSLENDSERYGLLLGRCFGTRGSGDYGVGRGGEEVVQRDLEIHFFPFRKADQKLSSTVIKDHLAIYLQRHTRDPCTRGVNYFPQYNAFRNLE